MEYKNISLYPVYHPAAGLRNGNIMDKLQMDFTRIPEIMELVENTANEKRNKQEDSQLNLFWIEEWDIIKAN